MRKNDSLPPGKHLCMYTAVPGGNFISVPVSRPRLQILSTWSLHLPQFHWPFPSPVRFTSGFFMPVFISHHCRSPRPHRPLFRLLWALWQRPGTAVPSRRAFRCPRPASPRPHRPLFGTLWALWQRPGVIPTCVQVLSRGTAKYRRKRFLPETQT